MSANVKTKLNSYTDLKKIFKKSVDLLTASEKKLATISSSLKKSVIRLSAVSSKDDEALNTIIEKMTASVSHDIKLEKLDDCLNELFVYINKHPDNKNKKNSHRESKQIIPDDSTESPVRNDGTFVAVLENIALSSANQSVLAKILQDLDTCVNDPKQWISCIEKVVELINQEIIFLQEEKSELNEFIQNIGDQLLSIEHYVKAERESHDEKLNSSQAFRKDLDNSVEGIQTEVSSAQSLDHLKINIESYLSNIKEKIETNQSADVENERVSKQKYESMLNELALSKQETEKLKSQLVHSQTQLLKDTLTELPNRLAYNERVVIEMDRSQRTSEPLSMAIWDIDNFKQINDNFGHDAGDKVLKLFSDIITKHTRDVDMFARVGGEEFVLLMPNTNVEAAYLLNEKLRLILEKYKFHYDGRFCPVTSSIGIALFTKDTAADRVFKHADEALYLSKTNGKNCSSIYERLDQ